MKQKSFVTQRTVSTGKNGNRQNGKREKIFTNPTSDIGLISKIYKELKKLDINKPNNPIKKWDTDLNREFSIDKSQMAKKHTEVFIILSYQGNTNQNDSETLSYTCQNGQDQ